MKKVVLFLEYGWKLYILFKFNHKDYLPLGNKYDMDKIWLNNLKSNYCNYAWIWYLNLEYKVDIINF